jgi:hypothetical protein
MLTLKQAIEATKCRKGAAHATTKSGAFWLAVEPIKIRSWGGDGIGNNGVDWDAFLQLRHYRNGTVRAMVQVTGYHQNGSPPDRYHHVAIEDCTTIEDIIVALKSGVDGDYGREAIYGDHFEDKLTAALSSLGMAVAAPSPDEQ